MQEETESLGVGEIRVRHTGPITGERGSFQVIAEYHSEARKHVSTYVLAFNFERRSSSEGEEIEASFVVWMPGDNEMLFLEDLEVIGYVEQYLRRHGLDVGGQLLGDEMYRPPDAEDSFEADAPLEIE